MAYLRELQLAMALSPSLQHRVVSASTVIAGATLAVSLGLLVWAFVKTH
jgi:uncharacterized membrane protein YgaE (UPF0421/DUF939 family)